MACCFAAMSLSRFSRPAWSRFQRALAVKRMDCRVSFRDLKRGVPTLAPLRLPVSEAKKFL